jgi:hypothetical protein
MAGSSASYTGFMVGSSSIIQLNFCDENPRLRKAANRSQPDGHDNTPFFLFSA